MISINQSTQETTPTSASDSATNTATSSGAREESMEQSSVSQDTAGCLGPRFELIWWRLATCRVECDLVVTVHLVVALPGHGLCIGVQHEDVAMEQGGMAFDSVQCSLLQISTSDISLSE